MQRGFVAKAMTNNQHTLYNFRRCPYAMRARMALWVSGIIPYVIEVDLKDRPPRLLVLSPKGSVPVLQTADGTVIDESIDIMRWALNQNDPDGWLRDADDAQSLIKPTTSQTGWFKNALDRYKYGARYPDEDCSGARDSGQDYLERLNARLKQTKYLCADHITYADIAIFPFVRQFANTDRDWFDALPLPELQKWLAIHLESPLFRAIMEKQKPVPLE